MSLSELSYMSNLGWLLNLKIYTRLKVCYDSELSKS
jgi:hypothetical protein